MEPQPPPIRHSDNCGVNTKTWKDCICGLVDDDGFCNEGNHKIFCPCHCTCDFMKRFTDYINEESSHDPA
jgi:hypothetical protein